MRLLGTQAPDQLPPSVLLSASQGARMELLDALGSNTALAGALATYQVD